jgi:hypothetical protein
MLKSSIPCFIAAAAVSANAATIIVEGDITTSVNWTKDNVYSLRGQVFVLPGGTISIEAGTVIASETGGSLAVTRGAMIDCNGSPSEPVIFTSMADYNTWTPSNPRGQWLSLIHI